VNNLKSLLGPMRVPFLILTPACVLLGLGTAIWTTGRVNAIHVVLVLIGAVSAHISVNAFNEYFDFRSGLDLRTTRTPFSGGSGTLPAQPQMARPALFTASIAFVLTGLIGLYFVSIRGLALLPLGLLGLFLILAYTVWLAYNPILCLLAPGTGFGPLMVMGTHVALTGQYSWTAFIASLVPFFLVNNLLLLNQFPDVQADQSIGRRHFPLIVGRRASSYIYGAFLLLTYVAILAGVGLGQLPLTSLIGLGTAVIAVPAFLGAVRHAEEIQELIPSMGLNVIINIATPSLVAVGLLMR
jgi:1,4-dihydroxy-2-naphthoate octaprenyltransferase